MAPMHKSNPCDIQVEDIKFHNIIPLKQLRVPKQIAIITRQHHTSQPIESQRPARHRLPAGLERHRGKRDEDLPVQVLLDGVADGDDQCSEGDQQRLEEVGGDEDPALFGGEGAVEAGEEEGTEAEGEDGDAGALPAVVVVGRDEAEAEVDCVACLGVC